MEAHGPFAATLDRSTRADSAGVQRWQQRIREELSHRAYFKVGLGGWDAAPGRRAEGCQEACWSGRGRSRCALGGRCAPHAAPPPLRPTPLHPLQRTGQKRGGEAVWVLDSREFDAMPERQRRKLADLRLPAAPQLGRHGTRN